MSDVTAERWLPVPGEDGYEVSTLGRVRSFRRRGHAHLRDATPRILKPGNNGNGYLRVGFGRKSPMAYVHQVVMEAFAGPCPPGKEVRHLDGNRANNRWAPGETEEEVRANGGNLFYGTRSENNLDKREHGTNTNQNTGKEVCDNGHDYTDANTYWYPNGQRGCRTCRADFSRRWRQAKRAAKLAT